MTLRSTFDFNQVVEQGKMGMIFAGDIQDVTSSKFTYPDIMGGRLTNFRFTDTFTKDDSVIATITYDASTIGEFDVMAGFRFRREFEVDPMSEQGFAGRMTDETGNQLPTGLFVPPGYLPPEIESFELKVEDKPEGTPTGDDGEDIGDATFAGPTFEFTFNNSNFGGSTQQNGLFEVTIEYEEGTKLEPRWQNSEGGWSKVGIIDDSVRWDYPEEGYVTFKVSHLTKFAVLANVAGAVSSLRCDFTGDGVVGDADLMLLLAARQTKGLADIDIVTYDVATVKSAASDLYSAGDYTNAILPDDLIDDLDSDGQISDQDLMALLAYLQTRGLAELEITALNEETVTAATKDLLPSFTGTVVNMPGEKVSR
jgi:hypothetical protein